MDLAVRVGVPALVFFAMSVVGMDLAPDDFRRVRRQPRTVFAVTVGQFLLLPAVGWLLVRGVELRPAVAHGLLLVTACPSGPMASFYTLLGRGNVALSVTLTAVSCVAAVVATPLALGVLQPPAAESAGFAPPLATLSIQLVVLLLVPVAAGMGIRQRWPEFTRRRRGLLLCLNLACLGVLLVLIIAQQAELFARALAELVAAAGLLTVVAFAAGWATARVCGVGPADRFTVGMVFVVRNVGIATAIAVAALSQGEVAVFAAAYFLAQVPPLLMAALAFRRFLPGDEGKWLAVERP